MLLSISGIVLYNKTLWWAGTDSELLFISTQLPQEGARSWVMFETIEQ